jgi:ankyrin repeat protein
MLGGGMQQSLDDVAFERGLWGYIIREPTGAQVAAFIASHGQGCVDLPDKAGFTPLLYAARHGNAEACEVLLSRGASITSATPGFRQTALHRAAMAGHVEVAKVLLRHGAERFATDLRGKTPLDLVDPDSATAQQMHQLLSKEADGS